MTLLLDIRHPLHFISYYFSNPIHIFALCSHLHHSATANGNVGLVKYVISHGQSINSVLDSVLPLHATSSRGMTL
ncbi:hypothetical protein PILCRDRAFT_821419 [Piloderma croceum F 1598]|uniref:Uncharacterized protein n=1 Tax=Piloderma croceum (strain F 1598) TaxID=765440 RepID=A0A0C3BWD8_PILCF|nr:hypothetical protein PILCRDRAFT_821419 [Piloderma croceum F 1598]